jgi:hypothetical protein|nr:MAG TPA: hypothetical protein [Caudoviricetes sp.]
MKKPHIRKTRGIWTASPATASGDLSFADILLLAQQTALATVFAFGKNMASLFKELP